MAFWSLSYPLSVTRDSLSDAESESLSLLSAPKPPTSKKEITTETSSIRLHSPITMYILLRISSGVFSAFFFVLPAIAYPFAQRLPLRYISIHTVFIVHYFSGQRQPFLNFYIFWRTKNIPLPKQRDANRIIHLPEDVLCAAQVPAPDTTPPRRPLTVRSLPGSHPRPPLQKW